MLSFQPKEYVKNIWSWLLICVLGLFQSAATKKCKEQGVLVSVNLVWTYASLRSTIKVKKEAVAPTAKDLFFNYYLLCLLNHFALLIWLGGKRVLCWFISSHPEAFAAQFDS